MLGTRIAEDLVSSSIMHTHGVSESFVRHLGTLCRKFHADYVIMYIKNYKHFTYLVLCLLARIQELIPRKIIGKIKELFTFLMTALIGCECFRLSVLCIKYTGQCLRLYTCCCMENFLNIFHIYKILNR